MERMHEIQLQLDAQNAWSLTSTVEATLDRLSLPKAARIGTLSGGLKKRVALAAALVSAPDVLLLDEPTNHLDYASIVWLENLLTNFQGSVLLITHDRCFLDNVCTRIIELDRGQILSFPGNFSTYQIRKAELLENELIENAKFDKFLAQEEVWIRKGVQARRTRDEGRVSRLEELRKQRSVRRDQQGQVKLDVSAGERSGKIVAELIDVSKSYGSKHVVNKFSGTILRGDKVGLIGANGTGKTTLLKMILGEEHPDSGVIKRGSKLQVAYFDQMRTQLAEDASLLDTIAPGSDWVEVNGQKKHVMTYLNDFLFAPERARSPVKSLSGGERNRLLLARLFAKPANVLVLDEPTNDLDIDTLELLEELLVNYTGTVFLVSHDRAFLDNVVTQVIVSEGDGRWCEYVGGFSDWARYANRVKEGLKPASKLPEKVSEKIIDKAEAKNSTALKKLSFKEQRELEELPGQIAQLESEQQQITQSLQDTNLYKTQPAEVAKLNIRYAEIESLLLTKLERWENLEERT